MRRRCSRSRPLADRPGGILPDVTAAVGHTPLVALDRLGADVRPRIVAKLEHMNPGGSVKDRIALPMIEAAERAGLLKPGGVIVEPTSGNTGIGLAQAAAVKGYRCIFVMADKQSEEKRALLRAYGAELVICPTDVDPDDERSYYRVSDQLARETPGAWKPDQYHNDENPRAHYETTGPEIWEATDGRITHLVVAIGTGGTVTGVARFLKERNADVQVIGADPAGSVYSGATPHPYLTEGIGEDFWPTTYDADACDAVVQVSDRDSMLMARIATAREGIFMGQSCGTALWAALQVAREVNDPAALFVVILPDSGRNYVAKLYSDSWLRENGLLGPHEEVVDYDWRATGPAMTLRGDEIPHGPA
jgi:cystathionine beta-synthase